MIHQLSQLGFQHLWFLFPVFFAGGSLTPLAPQPALRAADPQRAIVIRVSESMLQPPGGGKVDQLSPVRRTILGTEVSGTCRTVGQTRVDVVPDENDGSFKFVFTGTSFSRTSGQSGPATIHNSATTQFQCTKRVTFDLENGFQARPSEVKATTQLRNDGVTAKRRGLIGRVVRNVATRRVQETQAAATTITNQDAKRDLARGFDEAIDKQLAQLNKQLNLPRLLAALFGTATRNHYCVRSNSEYLEICFHDSDKGSVQDLVLPEHQVAATPVQIWARSTLFDGKVRAALQAYTVAQRVIDKLTPVSYSSDEAAGGEEPKEFEVVGGWIVFNWKPAPEVASVASVGEATTLR